MKKSLIFTMAAATVLFAGCNKSGDTSTDSWNGELRLSSGVVTQARAFTTMDAQLPAGQGVTIYVDNATSAVQRYGNNVLIADGNGALSGGAAMYFPEDKSKVNIYAFHTNATLDGTFPDEIIQTVSADQTKEANYIASDLLYAATKEVAATKSAVGLTFYHLLSKVSVAVKAGDGLVDLTGAKVSILGISLGAKFTPNKLAVLSNYESRKAMIAINQGGGVADIAINSDATTDFSLPVYNDAIIVPQLVTAGQFIKVTLSSGAELFYMLPGDINIESGKKYLYHITVNLTGLTVSSTIADWEAVNPVQEGSAEM